MASPILDLTMVETYSLTSIGIGDISNYQNLQINNPSLEITPPGFSKVNVPFNPKEVNTYKADELNIDCDSNLPLPDGFYRLKYSINPNNKFIVEKSFFRVQKTLSLLHSAVISTTYDPKCDVATTKRRRDKISQIKYLIEGAVSSAAQCDEKQAIDLLKRANKELKSFEDSCG